MIFPPDISSYHFGHRVIFSDYLLPSFQDKNRHRVFPQKPATGSGKARGRNCPRGKCL